MQKSKCADVRNNAKDGGVILVIGHGKRGGMFIKQTGTVQTYGSSQTTCIRSWVIVSVVIPLKCAFQGRSSSSREVVVHGS